MPKKLSKIGQMFQSVREAAAAARRGIISPDEVEDKLQALEQELDQNIIYVDDDGSYDPSQPLQQSPIQKSHTPVPSATDKLAEMLRRIMQLTSGVSPSSFPSSVKDQIMKNVMEDYIQKSLKKGMTPSEEMEEAYRKKEEFDKNFKDQLQKMMQMASGNIGSGLTNSMKPYEEEDHRIPNYDKHILQKKDRSKEERNLQRIVQSILRDNQFDRFIGRKTRGRLDTNGLHRFPTNGRIFGQKEERKGKRYTATILVDLSGSMSNSIEMAAPAALRFHQILSEIIPVQVRGYNTSFYEFVEFGEKLTKKQSEVAAGKLVSIAQGDGSIASIAQVGVLGNGKPKYGMMNEPLTKRHQEIVKSYGNNYADKKFDTRGTLDGVAIRTLTDQLAATPGRHIIIVLNDGSPGESYRPDVYAWQDGFKTPYTNENLNLKKAVEYAQKKGILFVGIGIFSDAVRRYYPKKFCTVVKDESELATAFDGASKQLMHYVQRG